MRATPHCLHKHLHLVVFKLIGSVLNGAQHEQTGESEAGEGADVQFDFF